MLHFFWILVHVHKDPITLVDLFAYLFHLMKHKKSWVECASADQEVKCEGIWAQN
jgi:hypothetical protein